MNAVELSKFLARFDPRDAAQRGQLKWFAAKANRSGDPVDIKLRGFFGQLAEWAESVADDPTPTPPANPFDVPPAVKFSDRGPQPVSGWSETDRLLVARLADAEKLSDSERRRLVQLWHAADGDESGRLLLEQLLEPVRVEHAKAVGEHAAAVQRWAERRPTLPTVLRDSAHNMVAELLAATDPSIDGPTSDFQAKRLIENGGAVPDEAA